MEEVMVRIIGTQISNGDEDRIDFSTTGWFERRGVSFVLSFDEYNADSGEIKTEEMCIRDSAWAFRNLDKISDLATSPFRNNHKQACIPPLEYILIIIPFRNFFVYSKALVSAIQSRWPRKAFLFDKSF